IRLESGIERGEVGHPAPDAAESGQNRVVAVVERRVALGTQPLDPFGARQHLAQRGELLVLARLRRRFVELPELERQEIEPGLAIAGGGADTRQLAFDGPPSLERGAYRRRQRVERAEA